MTTTTDTIAAQIATTDAALTFGADEALIASRIAGLVEIVDEHRIAAPRLEGDWLVWDLRVSEQTASKFVARAKSRGYRSTTARRGRLVVHVDDLVEA